MRLEGKDFPVLVPAGSPEQVARRAALADAKTQGFRVKTGGRAMPLDRADMTPDDRERAEAWDLDGWTIQLRGFQLSEAVPA